MNMNTENNNFHTRSLINSTNFRDQTEENILAHLNFLDNIIQNSNIVFYEHNLEGYFQFISPHIKNILGYSPDEVNMKWDKLLTKNPKNKIAFESERLAIETGQKQPCYELELFTKDKKKIWLEIEEVPIVENGKTISLAGTILDITKRKQYETKLVESEENYRLLVESQDELIVKFDLEGRLTFVSPNYCKIFNVKLNDIIGKKFIPQIHSEDRPKIQHILDNSLTEPYNCAHTERMMTKKGWRWFSWRNRCIKNIDGEVKEIVSVGRDISERIESQEEIKKLALIAKETNNVVIITDKAKKVEWVNEAFTKITGYKLHEVIGQNPGKILQGEDTCKKTVKKIKNAIEAGKQIKTELLNYSKNGKKYWIEVNIQPIYDSNGEVVKYISIESDITKRKKIEENLRTSEARLKDAQKIAKIGNWQWDVVKNTVWWSDQTYSLFGLKTNEIDLVFDSFINFVLDEDRQFVKKSIDIALKTEQNFEFDCRILIKNKIEKTIHINGKPIFNSENIAVKMVGTLQDITNRKKIEQALSRSEEKFSKAFYAAPDAIMLSTLKEGKILEVNEGFEKIFEYSKKEVLGKLTHELGLWKFPNQRFEAKSILESKGKMRTREGEFITKSGKIGIGELSMDLVNLREEVCILSILRDITKRKEAEKDIQVYQKNLKLLSSQITLTEEAERRRIAVNLHDHLGQSLAMAKIKLTEAEKNINEIELTGKINEVKKYLNDSIESSRSITYQLSPPILYELGISQAVSWRLEQIEKENNISTSIIDNSKSITISEDVKILLFRAIMELINNVIKHANATKLEVNLDDDKKHVIVKISDNGIGFDPVEAEKKATQNMSFGMFNNRERISFINGNMKISSTIGKGTTTTIKIPNNE